MSSKDPELRMPVSNFLAERLLLQEGWRQVLAVVLGICIHAALLLTVTRIFLPILSRAVERGQSALAMWVLVAIAVLLFALVIKPFTGGFFALWALVQGKKVSSGRINSISFMAHMWLYLGVMLPELALNGLYYLLRQLAGRTPVLLMTS